jgi:hypothetical protein
MAELHKPTSSPSYIPVVAPRPTCPVPYLYLSYTWPPHPDGHQGIAQLLVLTPYLPAFLTPASRPSVLCNTFPNFGSVLRSMTGDRKNFATFTRPADNQEPSPVISIEASPFQTDTATETLAHDSRSSSVDHLSFSPVGKSGVDIISESSRSFPCDRGWESFNLCSDIETSDSMIVERSPYGGLGDAKGTTGVSGISKHIPNLDEQDPTQRNLLPLLSVRNLSPSDKKYQPCRSQTTTTVTSTHLYLICPHRGLRRRIR